MRLTLLLVCATTACSGSDNAAGERLAAEVAQGRAVFQAQCALCHPTDNGRGTGPGLANVYGQKAASNPGFTYTKALRDSGLVWDSATLDQFLANPMTKVPGSLMVTSIKDPAQRAAVIAYLQSLRGQAPAP